MYDDKEPGEQSRRDITRKDVHRRDPIRRDLDQNIASDHILADNILTSHVAAGLCAEISQDETRCDATSPANSFALRPEFGGRVIPRF